LSHNRVDPLFGRNNTTVNSTDLSSTTITCWQLDGLTAGGLVDNNTRRLDDLSVLLSHNRVDPLFGRNDTTVNSTDSSSTTITCWRLDGLMARGLVDDLTRRLDDLSVLLSHNRVDPLFGRNDTTVTSSTDSSSMTMTCWWLDGLTAQGLVDNNTRRLDDLSVLLLHNRVDPLFGRNDTTIVNSTESSSTTMTCWRLKNLTEDGLATRQIDGIDGLTAWWLENSITRWLERLIDSLVRTSGQDARDNKLDWSVWHQNNEKHYTCEHFCIIAIQYCTNDGSNMSYSLILQRSRNEMLSIVSLETLLSTFTSTVL
jgi:hypothetical protein